MQKELSPALNAERSIGKKYRKEIWNPFVEAVKTYRLIEANDKIAVCISGGKDSMLLAVALRMLERFTEIPFSLVFLSMDPGYAPENRKKLEENAALLNIPLTVFGTNVFRVANEAEKNPCYLCAKMRRGHLYAKARELGCNKIALGHHFSDVIETTVLSMFYGAQLQGMMPKLHSVNYPGMELIRPLYCVHEDAIIAWARYNSLEFLQCACLFTEHAATDMSASKRQEVKQLLRTLKQENPDIEKSIFRSLHAVCIDTFPGFKSGGVQHSFLERYDHAADNALFPTRQPDAHPTHGQKT